MKIQIRIGSVESTAHVIGDTAISAGRNVVASKGDKVVWGDCVRIVDEIIYDYDSECVTMILSATHLNY